MTLNPLHLDNILRYKGFVLSGRSKAQGNSGLPRTIHLPRWCFPLEYIFYYHHCLLFLLTYTSIRFGGGLTDWNTYSFLPSPPSSWALGAVSLIFSIAQSVQIDCFKLADLAFATNLTSLVFFLAMGPDESQYIPLAAGLQKLQSASPHLERPDI